MYAFIIMVFLSFVVGLIGKNRKFGFWGYFFASLLVTPIIGILLVLASDPRPQTNTLKINGK